jgi:phosphoribosylaminoimidazole-succinocarboxamide synthase
MPATALEGPADRHEYAATPLSAIFGGMIVSRSAIVEALNSAIDSIPFEKGTRFAGKVRENFVLGDGRMAIVVTDRVSVFDYKIGTVPFKGQVLNQLAAWWFGKLDDIGIPHHLLLTPHPNISVVRKVKPLPIEIVVRAYLTGTTTTSAWYAYQNNDRTICGIRMPAGMKKNEKFPELMMTPATKGSTGHDVNISRAEILDKGLVEREVLDKVEQYALTMFRHGQNLAREQGLILVDTKYEMGLTEEGALLVIDEVHTPDSSRYWVADSYGQRMDLAQEPDSLDKEFVRRMIIGAGYDVDSDENPAKYFDNAMRIAAAEKYLALYEKMTGRPIEIAHTSQSDIAAALDSLLRA